MRFKKYIPLLIYLFLILACLAIVRLTGKLAGPESREEEISASWEPTQPKPERPLKPQVPSPSEESSQTEPETQSSLPKSQDSKGPQDWQYWLEENPEATQEEPYRPPVLMLASDLHYISQNTHDDGAAFRYMVAKDDGKISQYSDVLIDTLVEEAITKKPSALVLTGDITLNGERENHLGLAEKLRRAKEAGIPVLVIPGNHDIKNQNAAIYFGDNQEPAEYLDNAQEFYEIYHEFGYDEALSRDEASLSYFYALDDTHWMLMLDTCQYEDYNHVNGRLKPETLEWMEKGLQQAKEQNITVLPAGHHNLLSESRLYPTECTMENHQEIIRLLEEYELPLYISGHLHAQRIKKHKREPGVSEDAYGIQEIVLSPYSIPPCQYGMVEWNLEGGLRFETRQADVEAYARSQGREEEHLLNFEEYGSEYVKSILEEQVQATIHSIPEELKAEMAGLYGELYYDYCAGNQMSRNQVKATKAYRLWERLDPKNPYVKEMGQMIEDVRQDLHDWIKE